MIKPTVQDEFNNAKVYLKEMEDRVKSLESRALSLGGLSFVGVLISAVSILLTKNSDIRVVGFLLIGVFPFLIVSQLCLILTFLRSPNFYPQEIISLHIDEGLLSKTVIQYNDYYLKIVRLYNMKSFFSKWGGTFLLSFILSMSFSLYFILYLPSLLINIWFDLFWLAIFIIFSLLFISMYKSITLYIKI